MLEQAALREWKSVLGSEYVSTEESKLNRTSTGTFATRQKVQAILYPENREQVQKCLRIAIKYSIPLYPISTGKNWGYGSSVPVGDGCVLMDLGRMNRIVDFNEDLGYATIEPGVTQGQLLDFLRARNSKLWIDGTGSSPECSLIGNVLERGFGHTPYGDHAANVCGFEVVLPTGDVIDTGFSRFSNSPTAQVYRWGLGPSLDGLFTQSNLGVITKMTLWLMPAPEYFQAFFFRCDNENALPGVIDALRGLRMSGTLRSAIHVGNDYKVLSGIQQYPWDSTGSRTPLTLEMMKKLRQEMKFGAWNGSGGLYGTRAQVKEARRLLRLALQGKADQIQFLDAQKLELAARVSGPLRFLTRWDLSKTLELVRPLFGLLQGIPSDRPLTAAYWRKKTPPPQQMDPDRDRCGLLWCSPVAPAQGTHARKIADLSSEIILRHGFEPLLSITLITERSLICVISLTYDRDVPGEDEKALACYEELQNALTGHGYPSYRLGIQAMDQVKYQGAYAELLLGIKKLVDPSGILAPGRYMPLSFDEPAPRG